MAATKDVAVPEAIPGFNTDLVKSDELNVIASYDEAIEFLGLKGISADEAAGLLEWDTNPYEMVSKDQLVGIPFMAIYWRFVSGSFGEFVVVYAVAKLPNGSDWLVMFTDGSAGVSSQLAELTNSRVNDPTFKGREQRGALVRGGLRRSEYETIINGEEVHGVTYYLSNTLPKKG